MKLPILLFLSKLTSNKRSVFFCLKYINTCNIAECLWMNFSKNELSYCYLCDPLSFCWVFQNDIIHKITPHDFEHCSQSPINPQLDPDSALHSICNSGRQEVQYCIREVHNRRRRSAMHRNWIEAGRRLNNTPLLRSWESSGQFDGGPSATRRSFWHFS